MLLLRAASLLPRGARRHRRLSSWPNPLAGSASSAPSPAVGPGASPFPATTTAATGASSVTTAAASTSGGGGSAPGWLPQALARLFRVVLAVSVLVVSDEAMDYLISPLFSFAKIRDQRELDAAFADGAAAAARPPTPTRTPAASTVSGAPPQSLAEKLRAQQKEAEAATARGGAAAGSRSGGATLAVSVGSGGLTPITMQGTRRVVQLRGPDGGSIECWVRGLGGPTVVIVGSSPEALADIHASLGTNHRSILIRHAGAPLGWRGALDPAPAGSGGFKRQEENRFPLRSLKQAMGPVSYASERRSYRSETHRPHGHPDAVADELAAVLRELDVGDDVIIVAAHYDWAGALRFAERNAEAVAGLILLDPLLPWPSADIPERYPAVYGNVAALDAAEASSFVRAAVPGRPLPWWVEELPDGVTAKALALGRKRAATSGVGSAGAVAGVGGGGAPAANVSADTAASLGPKTPIGAVLAPFETRQSDDFVMHAYKGSPWPPWPWKYMYRACGLLMPLEEMAISHWRPVLAEHIMFDRLVRHALYGVREVAEPLLDTIKPQPLAASTLHTSEVNEDLMVSMGFAPAVFLEEQVNSLRAADLCARLASHIAQRRAQGIREPLTADDDRLLKQWGPLQSQSNSPVTPPLPQDLVMQEAPTSVEEIITERRTLAPFVPVAKRESAPLLVRGTDRRPEIPRAPWASLDRHTAGLHTWLSSRTQAALPFPVRVLITTPELRDINAPIMTPWAGGTYRLQSSTPSETVMDLRRLCRLHASSLVAFWSDFYTVAKVHCDRDAVNATLRPDATEVAGAITRLVRASRTDSA